ncbi:MAG TPA: oxygen-dependent coproporphyrinogen oxidase [Steroidobacteraceae bacterium]|nr:oxygen-dependent coproporphyrinogen oxidase [Steroidobacteraceae bacterium]
MMVAHGSERAQQAVSVFDDLQSRICARLQAFEGQGGAARFESTRWSKPAEHRLKGGGHMRLMRGAVLEKVGVNVSHVWGTLSEAGIGQLPGATESAGDFIACGISLVAHPANPHAPTAHLNLRYLATSIDWIGGGSDLTPATEYAQDTQEFHAALRGACESYRPNAYEEYRDWCDRYFFLPHRNERRGVGGIFFDNLRGTDWASDLAFLRGVGEAFLNVYPAILERRIQTPFDAADRARQLLKRGRYVEFNLVYDRGTRFGFMTDANPEAYLMSLPPLASW